MTVHELVLPQRNYFGEGSLEKLAEDIATRGINKVLLISDRGVHASGILKSVVAEFSSAGVNVCTETELAGEPKLLDVARVLNKQATERAEVFVGVGGGSVLDLTKAVALCDTNGPDIAARVGLNRHALAPTPFYLVSTAPGTAAELSRAFIITDEAMNEKLVFKDDRALPAATACDPRLMTGLPASVTANGAMDTLAHALEGYLSRRAWGLSQTFSVSAVRLVLGNLEAAIADPTDISRREALIYAQTLAGMSLGSSGVGIGHAIGHPLGSRMGVPHGKSVGMLLPSVLAFEFSLRPEIGDQLAEDVLGPYFSAQDLVGEIDSLARKVGCYDASAERELSPDDIAWVVSHAAIEPNLPNCVNAPTPVDIERILVSSWKGEVLPC